MVFGLVLASILFQIIAAVLALRMIRITGKPWAWSFIAAGLLLMIIRRCFALQEALALGGKIERSDLAEEVVGLIIACLLLIGMAGVKPIFTSIEKNAASLRENREKYRTLLEQAGDGIFVSDDRGMFLEVNPEACTLLGYERHDLLRMEARDVLPENDPVLGLRVLQGLLPGRPRLTQCKVKKKSGEIFEAELSISRLTDGRVQVIVRDVTERRRLEDRLRESEERFRRTFDEGPIGATMVGLDMKFQRANAEFCRFIKYSEEELRAMSVWDLLRPEDRDRAPLNALLAGEVDRYRAERRNIAKGGDIVWGRLSVSAVRDREGKPLYLIALMEDITERKEAEEHIQQYQARLRELSIKNAASEEREKRRIAGSLHDDLAQVLALAKMKLGAMRKDLKGTTSGRAAEETQALLDSAIQSIRTLTFDLSPPVLYELGFEPAVEWLGDRVREDAGIAFHLQRDGEPPLLTEEQAAILFRAVRELLNNVMQHSEAQNVTVTLANRGAAIQVTVADDGVGLGSVAGEEGFSWTRGYGLFSIRERLQDLGGKMELGSGGDGGARISLSLPLGSQNSAERGDP